MTPMPGAASGPSSVGPLAWAGHELLALRAFHDPLAYDPATDVWRALPSLPGATDGTFGYATAIDGRWIVFGSSSPGDRFMRASGAVFDPATSTWASIAEGPLSPRYGYSVVAAPTTHELLVWGGYLQSGEGVTTYYRDGAAYSLVTRTWRTIAASPMSGGNAGMVHWDGARMLIVFPQGVEDGESPMAVAAAYDPASDAWTSLPLPGVAARVREYAASVSAPSTTRPALAFWSGYTLVDDGTHPQLRDGAWWSPTASAWTTIAAPPTTILDHDRELASSFGANGRLYVWGGRDVVGESYTLTTDGFSYDLTTGAWAKMPLAGAPAGRTDARAAWTGCDVIVIGGRAATGVSLLDGARYRP